MRSKGEVLLLFIGNLCLGLGWVCVGILAAATVVGLPRAPRCFVLAGTAVFAPEKYDGTLEKACQDFSS